MHLDVDKASRLPTADSNNVITKLESKISSLEETVQKYRELVDSCIGKFYQQLVDNAKRYVLC